MTRFRVLAPCALLLIILSLVISQYLKNDVRQEDINISKDQTPSAQAEVASGLIAIRGTPDENNRNTPEQTLTGTQKRTISQVETILEKLEKSRIFDRSQSVKNPLLAELLREPLGLTHSTSPIRIEVDQIALDAPSAHQIDEIIDLINQRISEQSFPNATMREAIVRDLEERYLNFPESVKFIERNKLEVEDSGEVREWISESDTNQIMEIKKPEGPLLSPEFLHSERNVSFDTIPGGWRRYGHLFD